MARIRTTDYFIPVVIVVFCLISISVTKGKSEETGDAFYFAERPEAKGPVRAGESTELRCRASQNDGIAYTWELDGELVPNTTRRFQRGSHLIIRRVDPVRDAGEFKCIATNTSSGYSSVSEPASLRILWLSENVTVTMQSPESPKEVYAGKEVVLRCVAHGSGEIHYSWFKNMERLTKGDHISPHGKSLHIKNVSAMDNGVYSCEAKNEAKSIPSQEGYPIIVLGGEWATIEDWPKDALVSRGATTRMECSYRHALSTHWYFLGKVEKEGSNGEKGGLTNVLPSPLTNTTNVSILSNGTLIIWGAEPEDEGVYACGALWNDAVRHQQQRTMYSAHLRLAFIDELGPQSLKIYPEVNEGEFEEGVVVVAEGKELEIECVPPAGKPTPSVHWLPHHGRNSQDSRLVISYASHSRHPGEYTCVAKNTAGSTRTSIKVIVSVAPKIDIGPLDLAVEEGQWAMLPCSFKGSPYPATKVKWLKEGAIVAITGSHPTSAASGAMGVLSSPTPRVRAHINNGSITFSPSHPDDTGQYQCSVEAHGYPPILSNNATFVVKERLKFLPRPVNKRLELDSVGKLYCKVQGAKPLRVRWMKAGAPMMDFPSHVRDNDGTLVLDKVQRSDAGQYTCVATNAQGIINATIEVEVIVTPKFTIVPLNPTEAYEGYPVMMNCKAEGDPPPTIQWDKNSVLNGFDQKRFVVLENGSLYVKEVQPGDDGKYGCTAGNSGGFKREEVTLLVRSGEGERGEIGDEGLGDGSMMTKTVTITLSAAAAYMLLVVGLMFWCRYRRLRRKQAYAQANGAADGDGTGGGVDGASALLTKAENGDAGGVGDGKEGGAPGDSGGHSSSSSLRKAQGRAPAALDRITFPRKDLHSFVPLGKGEFGEVFLARAKGLKSSRHAGSGGEGSESESGSEAEKGSVVVMVKALEVKEETALTEFKRQLDLFGKARHPNVAKLVGLCRDANPHYMLLEYSAWGDLKQYLVTTCKGSKPSDGKEGGSTACSPTKAPLTESQCIDVVKQVALGMEHIASLRFVHRDLAARNCLIYSSGVNIKISAPSLSKDTYAAEYHTFQNQLIPLRWMSPEAVLEDDSSTKSDVWAWGVLANEVFSGGEMPLSQLTNDAIVSGMRDGGKTTMHQVHASVPTRLQSLLESCWATCPRDRPSFPDIVAAIGADTQL
ncbi:inactive tyrosine-protein kinase 7-like [Ischnura elegans]|uniref:inactive tyrosine-protein kinase 7-like n=1 Tax=Ischnura elegans TaxID=197161 RepID=UPI001ED8AEBC|nr:inactive tyrosine-protein kinase 7-like [Ischnura elegans]